MAGVTAGERLLVDRLVAVVQLLQHSGPQLFGQRLGIKSLECEHRHQLVEPIGIRQVGADGVCDAGVLHFDGNLAPVEEHRPVDLADRRRRRRVLRRNPSTRAQPRRPHSRSSTARATPGGSGGASDCRPANACWAPSGSPSPMMEMSWPAFITTPFICPSSRAMSWALRTTNASPSWRRSASPRRRLASHSPAYATPWRAPNRHNLALRTVRSRSAANRADRVRDAARRCTARTRPQATSTNVSGGRWRTGWPGDRSPTPTVRAGCRRIHTFRSCQHPPRPTPA